jgi:hypothetical protein
MCLAGIFWKKAGIQNIDSVLRLVIDVDPVNCEYSRATGYIGWRGSRWRIWFGIANNYFPGWDGGQKNEGSTVARSNAGLRQLEPLSGRDGEMEIVFRLP